MSREGRSLLLRFDAPLLSFGGLAVDATRPTREFPSRSMLTGLLANALGWRHGDFRSLQRLQQRLVYAVRRDRRGELLRDFQTVDLGQEFMGGGWTTRGRPESRGGGNKGGTHIRDRHYLAGALYTVALRLEPADESPRLDDLWLALRKPARPIFLGRKACVPSRPLVTGRSEDDFADGASVAEALRALPPWDENHDAECSLWWPDEEPTSLDTLRRVPVSDDRDWTNQQFVGRRFLRRGVVELRSLEEADGA